MRLLHLSLHHFRSYTDLQWELGARDVHLLLGPNGSGKTNILEAISILSLVRSCLGAEEIDLFQWEQDFYRVRGETVDDGGEERVLEVVHQTEPRTVKVCFVNDVKVPVERLIGMMPTVVFLPQDLQLFTGAPNVRRRFLDRLLCQVSPQYLQHCTQYQKVLKQRNSLLRRIAQGESDSSDLAVWDQHLMKHGVPMTLARLELLETLQLTLPEEIKALGEDWSDTELRYSRQGEGREEGAMRVELQQKLESVRERDVALQSTTVGPHREDFCVSVEGRDIATFASRGQQRTTLLALLLLQVSYLELRCGEKPIILLDDVFSELDEAHQRALLESLGGYQVLMTATRLPDVGDDVAVWEVGEGKVQSTSLVDSLIR